MTKCNQLTSVPFKGQRMARPLVSVITTLLIVAIIFIVECGIARFLCAMRAFEKFGHRPHPLGYLYAKFRSFRGLHC